MMSADQCWRLARLARYEPVPEHECNHEEAGTRIVLQVLGTRDARASSTLMTLMSFLLLAHSLLHEKEKKTRIIELSIVVNSLERQLNTGRKVMLHESPYQRNSDHRL